MAGGYLTTHVLDTARGCPAGGLRIELFRLRKGQREKIAEAVTNQDGRTDAPILGLADFAVGEYELVFHAGDYLTASAGRAKAAGSGADPGQGSGPRFLDLVPIRFGIADGAAHYHVPLLLSPYGYSTYRGS